LSGHSRRHSYENAATTYCELISRQEPLACFFGTSFERPIGVHAKVRAIPSSNCMIHFSLAQSVLIGGEIK
jgi:hypothetical protein